MIGERTGMGDADEGLLADVLRAQHRLFGHRMVAGAVCAAALAVLAGWRVAGRRCKPGLTAR